MTDLQEVDPIVPRDADDSGVGATPDLLRKPRRQHARNTQSGPQRDRHAERDDKPILYRGRVPGTGSGR